MSVSGSLIFYLLTFLPCQSLIVQNRTSDDAQVMFVAAADVALENNIGRGCVTDEMFCCSIVYDKPVTIRL
jgi:hypothetical protein